MHSNVQGGHDTVGGQGAKWVTLSALSEFADECGLASLSAQGSVPFMEVEPLLEDSGPSNGPVTGTCCRHALLKAVRSARHALIFTCNLAGFSRTPTLGVFDFHFS